MITIIDLSVPHQNLASGPYPPSMTHTGHAEGARRLALRAKVELADFPDGLALAFVSTDPNPIPAPANGGWAHYWRDRASATGW